jgi:conjugative transfer ATPase
MTVIGNLIDSTKKKFSTSNLFSMSDLEKLYERGLPSFASQLPFAGYDEHTQTWILEDCVSRAVCLTIDPITTEGRDAAYLNRVRDAIEGVYDAFEEKMDSQGQWVIQEFTYDDSAIEPIMKRARGYVAPHARGTKFTEEYLKMMERHLKSLKRNDGEGLFVDEEVTGEPWSLKIPRTKFIIYRRVSSADMRNAKAGKFDAARELNNIVEQIKVQFQQARVGLTRDEFLDVFSWLFEFFNPNPKLNNHESKEDYYKAMTDVDGEMVTGEDLCNALLDDIPESSREDNCWYFNKRPMRFLRFGKLRKQPRIGQLTGEVVTGQGNATITKCVMDSLPKGTILTKTVVITSPDEFELRFSKVGNSSNGSNAESEHKRNALAHLRSSEVSSKRKVLCSIGAYITADNLDALEDAQRRTITTLNNNNVAVFSDDVDGLSLNSFINHLPMNFRPLMDKKRIYLRSMWAQHAANLSLAFGRSEGSGNPCNFYFNRGGSPLFFDMFNGSEKENNSFGFIIGGPGSGKSVSICSTVYSIAAMKRPRIFIVEYGNSFEIAAQDWKKKGLSVNEMVITPKNCPSLAPFASIDKVLDTPDLDAAILKTSTDRKEEAAINDDDVDVLGELEQLAFMMITGSVQKEMDRFTRSDVSLLRKGLVKTAKRLREEGYAIGLGKPKPCITADVIVTLRLMANDSKEVSPKQSEILKEMAQNLEAYTSGFRGKLFNREGEAWPDVDVTLINLGTLAAASNRDMLNVAYTSLMQYVNNLAEATQKESRDIVMLTDESHLLTKDEMLSRLLVQQVKTSRKLGCWPIFATQNVDDMSGEAAKLLSMIEWFFCLNMKISEVEKIAKYRELTPEQIKLITSTRKQKFAYTEGVVVSFKNEYLIRAVPPSLYLVVAMTESEEKSERIKIMKDMNLSCELEAAYEMANEIDKKRGIEGRIEFHEI